MPRPRKTEYPQIGKTFQGAKIGDPVAVKKRGFEVGKAGERCQVGESCVAPSRERLQGVAKDAFLTQHSEIFVGHGAGQDDAFQGAQDAATVRGSLAWDKNRS